MVRIGNAQAFWGDRPAAARDLLRQVPELDYLTMDYLAEVSMSILALQRDRRPELGYPVDFVRVVEGLADYWAAGGRCRLIANAGGLHPAACADACRQVLEQRGCRSLKIGVVSGDDVLELLTTATDEKRQFSNLDDGRPLSVVRERLVTANAYLGCSGVLQALHGGADIVITGRVADPSLVLAACMHAFDWAADDWDRLAQGTIAGHLLECGTHVTGGISTDWLSVPNPAAIGFPYVEIDADGRCLVTKPEGTGGRVTEHTVKEQLLYEIGDPQRYLSPDVQVSFLDLQVRQLADDRVEVIGARGQPPPPTLKVSATYRDGYRAAGTLTIFGHQARAKAQRSGQAILERLQTAGWQYRDTLVESLGSGESIPLPPGVLDGAEGFESVMRVAVESDSKAAVEAFTQELMSLVTAGPQGTTGYAEGRPRVHAVFRYWPCLIEVAMAPAEVLWLDSRDTLAGRATPPEWPRATADAQASESAATIAAQPSTGRLLDLAYGRSGDKGTSANVGILARDPADYPRLARLLTADKVRQYFAGLGVQAVDRHQLPNLGGLNFILHGALRRGGRTDAQGKALAQALLVMPLDYLESDL